MFILIGSNLLVISVPLVLYLRTGKNGACPMVMLKVLENTHTKLLLFSQCSAKFSY